MTYDRGAMKLLLAFGLIVAMMGAASVPLHACSCAGPGRGDVCGPERSADAIFVGTVIGITDVSPGSFGTSKLVTLAVTEPFKNANAKVIDVGTGRGGGDCGFPFAVGTSYLVFAHERTGTGLLTTGICSNTNTRPTLRSSAGCDAALRPTARQPQSKVASAESNIVAPRIRASTNHRQASVSPFAAIGRLSTR